MIQLLSNSLLGLLPMNALLAQTDEQTNTAAAAGGAAGGLIGLVIGLVIIIAMWKVFSKAGQPGWAAIIPIYNFYVLCKVAGRPGWWLLLMLIPFVNFIIFIIVCIDIAKNFGKGTGFGLGLAILGVIFFPILGFGSAQYQGKAASA
jgi:Family of unknown function (DUF5684)